MPEDRLTEYLDGIDTAAEWLPIVAMLAAFAPPGYDEWNALRAAGGGVWRLSGRHWRQRVEGES